MAASKNRFAPELNEKEVIELLENTTPGSIKKATKYVMKIFQGKNFKTLCISQFQRCPSPPRQPRGICSNVCPGGGALAILSQPGGWALAYPGATPGHLTHVFLNMEEFVGKDEDFVKDWLVRHGLEKLVDVFKSMFSQF